jgi:hypothetical protein
MKLPKIKKIGWEKKYYPEANWVVTERVYNSYFPCVTLKEVICTWWTLTKYEFKRKKKCK